VASMTFDIVYIVGIVFALRRWQRHPAVSKWAFIGFALLLLNSISNVAYKAWGVEASQRGLTTEGFIAVGIVYGFAQQIIAVVGFAYLIAAIFGYRNIEGSEQTKPAS